MTKLKITICVLFGMVIGLPLVGVAVDGRPLGLYLEFPPLTRYVRHMPFSRGHFIGLLIILVVFFGPLLIRALVYSRSRKPISSCIVKIPFPWWGWLSLVSGTAFWVLAWTRFPWFESFQMHTFTPLWLSYIGCVNGLTYRRTGKCMLTSGKAYFLFLFPVSTLFWWIFEYLNRFVQNWAYLGGTPVTASEYIIFASISFSTVLPAVLGTRELLLTFPFFRECFGSYRSLRLTRPKTVAFVALLISALGLTMIAIHPHLTYPLLWVSPLVIIVSLQTLLGEKNVFSDICGGDWSMVVSSALAALVCGLFWEMWNFFSMAKWVYSIPYVHRYAIFEMPLLGYFGYLPFGLQCAAVGDMTADLIGTRINKVVREDR